MELEAIIGLEVHARINTATKMFCTCSNDIFGAEPNAHTCPICMGFPGMLPALNDAVIEKGVRTALALNCRILPEMKFDRKNYFYPDLPKGFQISQFDVPLSEKGSLEITVNGTQRVIGITRLHLEDDAGKNTHVTGGTLLDFNRCGTPLMEIVTEPDLRTADEADVFARELQTILRAVDSSYADMEKGMMRFDASVSMRPIGETKLYPRAEIKNLNSFKSLRDAVAYEIERQKKLWEQGSPLDQQCTVGWREDKGKTVFLREKETASDYRYFPEPDLTPFQFSDEDVERVRKTLPELPAMKRARYQEAYGLDPDQARVISTDSDLQAYFETAQEISGNPKSTANWVTSVLVGKLNDTGTALSESKVTPEALGMLVKRVDDGTITGKAAKDIFEVLFENGGDPEAIIKDQGMEQISDQGEIEKVCKNVIINNSKIVEDYRGGKEAALGALVGQVMAATKGKANPKVVNDILRKLINQ